MFLRKIANYWYLCVGTRVNHEHIARTQYKGKLGHVTMVDYSILFNTRVISLNTKVDRLKFQPRCSNHYTDNIVNWVRNAVHPSPGLLAKRLIVY